MDELPRKQVKEINTYNFKTPLSVVVANKEPENKFIELLTKANIAHQIDAWIKSRDTGFIHLHIFSREAADQRF